MSVFNESMRVLISQHTIHGGDYLQKLNLQTDLLEFVVLTVAAFSVVSETFRGVGPFCGLTYSSSGNFCNRVGNNVLKNV